MLGCWFLSSRAPLRSCDSIFATQVYLPRLYGSSLSSARRVFSLFHFCSSSLAGNKKESWSWSMWDQSLLMKSWGLKLISLLWVEQLSLGKKVLFWLCWVGTSADLIQGKTLPHNHPLDGLGVKGEDPQGEGVFPAILSEVCKDSPGFPQTLWMYYLWMVPFLAHCVRRVDMAFTALDSPLEIGILHATVSVAS